MIYEYIQKRIVKGLISEIGGLGITELELVGHKLVEKRDGVRLIHHGINKDYKPVKSTVDSFSEDSGLVAEYSTELDYFESKDSKTVNNSPSFPKIEKDIQHALHHRRPQGPDKIYLITNQEEPPSFRAKFNSTSIWQSHSEKIVFLDARELAKEVYRQSTTNQECAVFYKQYFPEFSQNLDNYEYYGKLPAPCDGYIYDKVIDEAITKHFETKPVCVLHGVSGSGKTQAAINFVRHHSGEFENYVWISGEDWTKDTSLSAIQRSRGGAPVNIVGLFKVNKTILIIDGLERSFSQTDFNELQDGFQKGGVVLVTSQSAILEKDCCLPIPEVSVKTAFNILGEDLEHASTVAKNFILSCKFSPLILSTARAMITQEFVPSEELYQEILASPQDLSGRDGQSIMGKILSRLKNGALLGLKKIANSGLTTHDLSFLRAFIGIVNTHKLQQLSILLPTNTPGVVKIHDLVCVAVRDSIDGEELIKSLEEYIGKTKGDMTPSVIREIHLTISLLQAKHTRRGERELDWLSYALLQVDSDAKLELQEEIYSRDIAPGLPLSAVMCLIDAREAHAYAIVDTNERNGYFRQCTEQFDSALADADDDVKAELLHHRGKALRRCGNHKEALNCFNQLLTHRPGWHATHGQIAHLGIRYGVEQDIKDAGERSLRTLIDEMIQDASSVPLRVSLAALASLRSYKKVVSELSSEPEKVQKLADIIALSALEGFGQFYEAFVSFTSKFGYHHRSICVDLAERLPEMMGMPPESVEKRQWVDACEALCNTAISAATDGRSTLFDRLISTSIKFADVISLNYQLKDYSGRAVAKAYNTANLPQKSLDAISKVPNDQMTHWILYRKAEAELMLGTHDSYAKALKTALQAIELADKDPAATENISSYHKLLSEIYERLDNISRALQEAECAETKCNDVQFKSKLTEHVLYLKSKLA